MSKYDVLVSALTSVTQNVSHGGRMKSSRYIVWQEDYGNYLCADGGTQEKSIVGTIDLFSKTELDEWAEDIEDALDAAHIAYKWNSTQFEENTEFWHWEWVFNL